MKLSCLCMYSLLYCLSLSLSWLLLDGRPSLVISQDLTFIAFGQSVNFCSASGHHRSRRWLSPTAMEDLSPRLGFWTECGCGGRWRGAGENPWGFQRPGLQIVVHIRSKLFYGKSVREKGPEKPLRLQSWEAPTRRGLGVECVWGGLQSPWGLWSQIPLLLGPRGFGVTGHPDHCHPKSRHSVAEGSEWAMLPSQDLRSDPGTGQTEATQAQARKGLLHTFPGTHFFSF